MERSSDERLKLVDHVLGPLAATKARRWVEAELALIVSTTALDATTSVLAELLANDAASLQPVDMMVAVFDDAIAVTVTGSIPPPETGEMAGRLLNAFADCWGVESRKCTVRRWARIGIL